MGLRRLSQDERRAAKIADIAFAAPDVNEFRRAVLESCESWIGLDASSIHSTTDAGHSYQVVTRNMDALAFSSGVSAWMPEFELAELDAASARRMRPDHDIISCARRDRLGWYREFVRPARIKLFLPSIWGNRQGVFGMTLGRSSPAFRFKHCDVLLMERLMPSIKLGEAYHSVLAQRSVSDEDAFDAWCANIRLTRSERRVASLAIRGLRNQEIAEALSVSPLTVKNQLSAIFRKADVTSRAELAFSGAKSLACALLGDVGEVRERAPTWLSFLIRGSLD